MQPRFWDFQDKARVPIFKANAALRDPFRVMPVKSKVLDRDEFVSEQLSLLEKERLAEVAEVSDAISRYSPSQLQIRGLALLNLVISSVRTGLGGKTCVLFVQD